MTAHWKTPFSFRTQFLYNMLLFLFNHIEESYLLLFCGHIQLFRDFEHYRATALHQWLTNQCLHISNGNIDFWVKYRVHTIHRDFFAAAAPSCWKKSSALERLWCCRAPTNRTPKRSRLSLGFGNWTLWLRAKLMVLTWRDKQLYWTCPPIPSPTKLKKSVVKFGPHLVSAIHTIWKKSK